LLFGSPRASEEYPEGDDEAQIPNCGSVRGDTDIWQKPPNEKKIEGFSQTTRQWTGCGSKVRVEAWIDRVDDNHNGVSEPAELQTASRAGLLGISTNAKESRRRDPHGNLFRLRAKAQWTVNDHAFTNYAYDVWLRVKRY